MIRRPMWLRPALPAAAIVLACSAGASHAQSASMPAGKAPLDAPPQQAGQDAPPTDRSRAEDLIARGRVQTELDELDAAESSFLDGIDLLIELDGEFSAALIDPYVGLSRVYDIRGETAQAITVLEQARHISQRNLGLFNLEQAALLDEMSRIYASSGETAEAQEIQRERLNIALRHYGADDPQVIPFRYHLAQYYELSRMRAGAREQFEAVVELLEARVGEDDSALLEPLHELVRIEILTGSGGRARRRLTEVLEVNQDARAWDRGRALAVLGDGASARNQPEEAAEYYRRAYAALSDEDAALAADFFSQPELIDFVPPLSPVDVGRGRGAYAWGSITARFSVSAQGQATGVAIVSATPPGLMDARYAQRLAQAHFRPRVVAGEPAPSQAVRFSHRFRYYTPE